MAKTDNCISRKQILEAIDRIENIEGAVIVLIGDDAEDGSKASSILSGAVNPDVTEWLLHLVIRELNRFTPQ